MNVVNFKGVSQSPLITPLHMGLPLRVGKLGRCIVGVAGSYLCISSETVAPIMSSKVASRFDPTVLHPHVITKELLDSVTQPPAAAPGDSEEHACAC